MLWGILYLKMLENGDWPPEHKETGYTGGSGIRNVKTKFLPAALFFAEITFRLKTTKEAGEALVDEVQSGLEYESLSRPAKRALNYIAGWRRRRLSYPKWKANQDWLKKGKLAVFS